MQVVFDAVMHFFEQQLFFLQRGANLSFGSFAGGNISNPDHIDQPIFGCELFGRQMAPKGFALEGDIFNLLAPTACLAHDLFNLAQLFGCKWLALETMAFNIDQGLLAFSLIELYGPTVAVNCA